MRLLDKLFGPPTKNQFAHKFIDAVREAGESEPVDLDDDEFRLSGAGGDIQMWLGDAYDEYCSVAREKRPETLHKWVHVWFAYRKEIPTRVQRRHSGELFGRARFGPV